MIMDTQTWTLYDGSTPIMDFNGAGSLETRYLNGPTGQLVDAVLGPRKLRRHDRLVSARPAGDSPRPDQQLWGRSSVTSITAPLGPC